MVGGLAEMGGGSGWSVGGGWQCSRWMAQVRMGGPGEGGPAVVVMGGV